MDTHQQDRELTIILDKRALDRAMEESNTLAEETKQLALEKKSEANSIAQYNKDVMELKAHYKTELPPIGDLFFKRQAGPDKLQLEAAYKQELANQVFIYFWGK